MILKHRDRELLRFEWVEPEGVRILSVNDAERRFLPLEMKGEATDAALWNFLRHRVVPKHRQHIQTMLAELGIAYSVRSLTEVSRGLSLNDVHWVSPDGFKADWRKVNLYDNPFSKIVGMMSFTGCGREAFGKGEPDQPETSPEFSTNGMLPKCWRRVDGQVVLYKGGTSGAANTGMEPYSEYYAAQLAAALDLPHIDYGLEKFKGVLCSTCPLFTSDRLGFVPAGRVVPGERALADPRFADIFFFDALILNTDRHLGNFGYLVNNDTNEIVGAAPIFDNGYGLFSLAMDRPDGRYDEIGDLRKFIRRIGPALYGKWCGFPGGISTEMQARLVKLKGFRFTRHPTYNLSIRRLAAIEDFLQKRINLILEYAEKADDLLLISGKGGGENQAEALKNGGDAPRAPSDESLALQIKANLEADPFITGKELAEILGVPLRTIERKMRALREAGQIRRVGSAKAGHWDILQ